jgi:hypothetical protein
MSMVENVSNATSTGSNNRDPLVERLRPIGRFFWEHPAIVGSLLYLQVTTVGVVYSWVLFRAFDINVFDYAEANDFLLAAFKDPIVFGMSILTLIFFTAFLGGLWSWMRRRRGKGIELAELEQQLTVRRVDSTAKTPKTNAGSLLPTLLLALVALIIILYSLVPPSLFAGTAAARLQSSSYEPLTSVQYRATSGSNEQTTETGLRVIGTTQSFVFFYDKKDSRTLIIPTAQIVEMKESVTKD